MPHEKPLDLSTCEREPIHVPGAIQPYGLLLVVDEGNDAVLQAGGDAESLFAYAGPLLGQTVQQILGISLRDLVHQADAPLVAEPTFLGTIKPVGGRCELTIAAHRVQGAAIVEVEPAVRSASAAKTLAIIRSITESVSGASDLLDACGLAAKEVRRITGYDRVLIYKFLEDGSGTVLAEERADHLPPFVNHRFPASDIPKQARDLYRRNVIRVIPDVDYTPAPLTPLLCPTTSQPLDMSHCILRSVSPVHIRYLKNMGVGASMSVSLLQSGELWGLVACHNATAKLLSYEVQEACRHVGQILSHQIRTREETEVYRDAHQLAEARIRILRALTDADNPDLALLKLCPELLTIVSSHGVAIFHKEAVVKAGHVPSDTQIRQLAAWLAPRISTSEFFATDSLAGEYPDAEAFTTEASGVLSTILPSEEPIVLMWFRAEEIEEINWAGNPHEAVESGFSLGALNPRKSFATWQETIRGRSRSWEAVDIESVQVFRSRAAFLLQQQRVRQLNDLLQDANERLSALATTDGLTGIANRRAFDERLEKEWARARRLGTSIALMTIDLDFFKQYNDHFGHLIGDDCLKQVTQVLCVGRRETDLVARIGGEEFSILLPDTNLEGALAAAETLRVRIEQLGIEHPKSPMGIMTASFGVAAMLPDSAPTPQDLMRDADRALYEAKRTGRNRLASAG